MAKEVLSAEVNLSKQILSSESKLFKTESLFYQTKKLSGIDTLILKIGESLLSNIEKLKSEAGPNISSFLIETIDKTFSFSIMLGMQATTLASKIAHLEPSDIIFFKDNSKYENVKHNDQRVVAYMRSHRIFKIRVIAVQTDVDYSHLRKLYYIGASEYINFPLLNEKQRNLVEIENQNVLVQGVAGSGKTNVCTNKIIFTACKNYSGKILYTTFSRALLVDTKNKIELFKIQIKQFIDDYKNNRIIFLDKNHKKAIENRLGILIVADNETNVIRKLTSIVDFLDTHVDYLLIEDLGKMYLDESYGIADERVFLNEFLKNVNNHQLRSKLDKLKNISYSIIYKEIYGLIFGCYREGSEMLELKDYAQARKDSFSGSECEIIYLLAKEFDRFKKSQNFADNNDISRNLLQISNKIAKYSLSIIDEVQDFTEVNLNLFKAISIKMFCVGDALQMINPSYFSFSYLKKLMYDEELTSVAELESNYRNNKKIVKILDALGKVNVQEFGTHSFVLSGSSMDETTLTNAIYVNGDKFLEKLKSEKFENFTILVNDFKEKEALKQIFKRQEILTISEIKGLERDTILLIDILSGNEDKWKRLEEYKVNHKQADENSVYRYYFNLFYVGVSRAKHNIFVYESKDIKLFSDFFRENFEVPNPYVAYQKFSEIISKLEIDDEEIYERIEEFLKRGQFDNARFYAGKLENDFESYRQNEKIDAYEQFVFKGKNKQAGIKLWKAGLVKEAKEQFMISGDTKLIQLLDTLETRSHTVLDAEIVKFFMDFEDNQEAQELIVDVLKQELDGLKDTHKAVQNKLKQIKEKNDGK